VPAIRVDFSWGLKPAAATESKLTPPAIMIHSPADDHRVKDIDNLENP